MLQNLLADSEYLVDSVEPVVIWLSVGVVAALIVAGLVLYFVKKDIVNTYVKFALLGFLVYALVIGILMVVLEITKHYSTQYALEEWLDREAVLSYVLVPLLVLFSVVLASTLAVLAAKKFLPAAYKPVLIVCGVLSLAALIAAAVFMGIYFSTSITEGGYYDGYETEYGTSEVNQLALYISAAALVVLAIVLAFVCDKGKKGFDTRSIAYAAVCIAMSFALSYVKIFTMPQGGSITLASLLPLMIYSYMFGTKKGVFACFIYGILQALQDPWIIHPAQFLLDYPVAFSFVGVAGAFANVKALEKLPQVKFALGAILASVLRYVSHVLSGVFAFSVYAYAKEFTSPWIYSLAYNSFVFIDIIIVIVAGILVFSSKAFNKQVDAYRLASKLEK